MIMCIMFSNENNEGQKVDKFCNSENLNCKKNQNLSRILFD